MCTFINRWLNFVSSLCVVCLTVVSERRFTRYVIENGSLPILLIELSHSFVAIQDIEHEIFEEILGRCIELVCL